MNLTPRLLLRDAVRCAVRVIPEAACRALRLRHQQAAPGVAKRLMAYALRAIRYRRPPDGEPDFAIEHGRPLRLANDGSWIANLVYWLGEAGYEPDVAALWARCCRAAHAILEIGANIGYMTVRGAAQNPAARYLAVEPNPDAVTSLRRNIALNRLDHVEVLECAMVGRADRATLPLCINTADSYTAPTGSHLGTVGGASAGERVIEVPVLEAATRMDGVDLVKIDAEGAELDILRGIRNRLGTQRALLFIEILDREDELRAFLAEFAREFRYRIVILCDGLPSLEPGDLPGCRLHARFGTRDALFLPAERPLP